MSLQVWLPLNGDLKNIGLSNLQFSNVNSSNTIIDNLGKIGKCYYNNSNTAGGIISNAIVNLGQQQSMFCWFKITTLLSDASLGGGLVSQHRHATNSGMGITIKYVSSTTGYLSVNTGNGSSRTYNTYYGTTLLQAGVWYHGGYTYDGTTLKIYVNGKCEGTWTITGMYVPADYVNVFCWSSDSTSSATPYGNYKFNGYINDARIYNHCLSLKEVKEIAKGLMAHYPLNNQGCGGANIIAGTSANEIQYTYPSSGYSDKFSRTTTVAATASQYILSFWAKSTVAGDKVRAHFYSPNTTTECRSSQGIVKTAGDGNIDFTLSTKWEKYWVIWSQSETTTTKNFIFPRMGSVADQPSMSGTGTVSVKCVKLEAGNKPTPWCPNAADTGASYLLPGNILYDTSGYGHNMTKFGTGNITYDASKTPKYQTCSLFDGSVCWLGNEFVDTFMPTDAITINCWVEWLGSSFNPISCTEGGGWNLESNGTYIQFPAYIYGVGYAKAISDKTPSFFADGKLHMLTGTLDCKTRTIKIYIDGVLNNTATYSSGDRIGYANNKFVIGGEAGGTGSSAGVAALSTDNISDVRIYATALSAEDIKELYTTSTYIDNKGNSYTCEYNENY